MLCLIFQSVLRSSLWFVGLKAISESINQSINQSVTWRCRGRSAGARSVGTGRSVCLACSLWTLGIPHRHPQSVGSENLSPNATLSFPPAVGVLTA